MLTLGRIIDEIWEIRREQEGSGQDLAILLDLERHEITSVPLDADYRMQPHKLHLLRLPAWELGGSSIEERSLLWEEGELAFCAYAIDVLSRDADIQDYLRRRN